jgi:hypothetical protein
MGEFAAADIHLGIQEQVIRAKATQEIFTNYKVKKLKYRMDQKNVLGVPLIHARPVFP